MQSDVKALMKVFGASALVALVGIGVLVVAAFDVIARDTAVYIAFGVFVVGVVLIAHYFGPNLRKRERKHHNHKHA